MAVRAVSKKVKLQIYMTAVEIINDSSSSEEDELLESLLFANSATIYRPRIRNYLDVVHEYSDVEFKTHFKRCLCLFCI